MKNLTFLMFVVSAVVISGFSIAQNISPDKVKTVRGLSRMVLVSRAVEKRQIEGEAAVYREKINKINVVLEALTQVDPADHTPARQTYDINGSSMLTVANAQSARQSKRAAALTDLKQQVAALQSTTRSSANKIDKANKLDQKLTAFEKALTKVERSANPDYASLSHWKNKLAANKAPRPLAIGKPTLVVAEGHRRKTIPTLQK